MQLIRGRDNVIIILRERVPDSGINMKDGIVQGWHPTSPSPALVVHRATGAPGRLDWIDYAKGIGIFLVVFGHVRGGLQNFPVLQSGGLDFALRCIFYFHMPLFFLLSGLFVRHSSRRPIGKFVKEKLCVIAYPYLLWSLIESTLKVVGAGSVNHPMSWMDLLKIAYEPIDQFWFLYVLFVLLVGYRLVYVIDQSGKLFFGLAAACYALYASGSDPSGPSVLQSIGFYAIYFALGAVVHDFICGDNFTSLKTSRLLLITLVGYGVLTLYNLDPRGEVFVHPFVASLGIFATLSLAVITDRWKKLGFVRTWGQFSLEIFVAHTIVAASLRIVMERLFPGLGPWSLLFMGTLAALYVPIMLALAAQRVGMPYLFTYRTSPTPQPAPA